jgi:DNA (cytosine-5)-methyltransferase 1
MNELALFAGAGGGILGGSLLGWRTVCAVEIDPYCRKVLLARQQDGHLSRFPIWDDIKTFNGKPWRGRVDIVSGGFPCQDISCAGKGAGITGEKSGLWVEMARVIREVRPRFAFVENSSMLTSRGLGYVLGDLAAMGYDARWGVLGAHHAGAPHKRDRIWIVCHPNGNSQSTCTINAEVEVLQKHMADTNIKHDDSRRSRTSKICRERPSTPKLQRSKSDKGDWWSIEPDVGRVADGVASRVDRLKAIGNGQVPAVVRLAWDILKKAE